MPLGRETLFSVRRSKSGGEAEVESGVNVLHASL